MWNSYPMLLCFPCTLSIFFFFFSFKQLSFSQKISWKASLNSAACSNLSVSTPDFLYISSKKGLSYRFLLFSKCCSNIYFRSFIIYPNQVVFLRLMNSFSFYFQNRSSFLFVFPSVHEIHNLQNSILILSDYVSQPIIILVKRGKLLF